MLALFRSDQLEVLLDAQDDQQLADQVRVTVRTINSIERGEYNPSLVLAYKIARIFHTTVEELCCLKENVDMEEFQNDDKK